MIPPTPRKIIYMDVGRLLGRVEEMAGRRDQLSAEIRELTIQAVQSGATKQDAARSAGISRPTLNKWLEAR